MMFAATHTCVMMCAATHTCAMMCAATHTCVMMCAATHICVMMYAANVTMPLLNLTNTIIHFFHCKTAFTVTASPIHTEMFGNDNLPTKSLVG